MADWIALYDDDGVPWAAYVAGHLDPLELCITAEDDIADAFGDYGPFIRECFDSAGGLPVENFWLRQTGEHDGLSTYELATISQGGAFPVTGVRFA